MTLINQRLAFQIKLLLLCALVRMPGSNAFAQAYLFGQGQYAVGNGPVAVATGDFNGDGKLDLAVVNSGDNTVSVLLGKPDGTFQPRTNYAVGSNPAAVAIGDFTGDGKLDLAVANLGSNTVSVLLGNGDGTFQPAFNYGTGSGPSFVAVGDFNGDGKLDLVVTNGGSYNVSVLLGNGDGSFQPAVNYNTGSAPSSVAVADFNGDGKPDLAVTNFNDGTVSILMNTGNGTFQAVGTYAVGPGAAAIAIGDFNGDGKPDLAVADIANGYVNGSPNAVSILLNAGNGTFEAAVPYYLGGMYLGFTWPLSLAVGDFNGDGKLDLAVATTEFDDKVSVLLGNGNGTFQWGGTYNVLSASYSSLSLPESLAVGDFNGDGVLDLAVVPSGANTVFILLGNFDGSFKGENDSELGGGNQDYITGSFLGQMATGDFNGDGNLDIAIVGVCWGYPCDSGQFVGAGILMNNGDGALSYTGWVDSSNGMGGGPPFVATGDFNGDGKSDLAIANNSLNLVGVMLSQGNGNFQAAVNYSVGSGPNFVAVGDFNGDGKLDLVVTNGGSNNVSVLLGNGDGTLQAAVNYSVGSGPNSVAVGDFNGDGKLDLAVTNGVGNNVSVLLGNGDGTFRAPVNYSTGAGTYSVAVGDFNGDGKLDLAVASANNVSVLLGNGDGTFQAPVNYSIASSSMTIGDLNGDGKLDLAVTTSGMVSVLLGNGDGTFHLGGSYSTGLVPFGVVAGDFNGDGNTDLAFSEYENFNVLSWTDIVAVVLNRPVIALDPDNLAFPAEPVGVTSAAQDILISNPGLAPLKISSVVTTGVFAQTNDCGSVLAGATCSIGVTFTPTSAGNYAGSLSIADNVPGNQQKVPLTGVSPDFAMGPAQGSQTSQTIDAGQSAVFNLAVTPIGSFIGNVSLSCTITPAETPAPTCSLPSSVSVSSATAAPFTVTVKTTAATTAGAVRYPSLPPATPPFGWIGVVLASGLLIQRGKRRPVLAAASMLLAIAALVACGSGGSSSSSHTTPGTPVGTYTATITANSGNLTHETTLTIIVH